VTCDQDLIPRITELNLIPTLVEMIVNTVSTIQNFEYLEYLQDFISTYTLVLDNHVGVIAQAVISRIQVECQKAGDNSTDIFCQKCVNILVHIT
jgi:hypothetical protein